ncbi:DUF5825 family protein [Streptomyces sp. NPDC006385]|uniref:DUF5825 family protein n=1 Tax=Streptomyces sp. NPDC006385 TaxID=3156761 RepID=UPI0033ADF9A5
MTTGPPLDVAHRLSGRRVDVTEPLRLGAGGRETAVAVRFLRECQSLGLRARWEPAYEEPACDISLLRHLPPPVESPGESQELRSWRAGHAYGMLYYRRGPGFVTVMDRRDRASSARYTLDHADLLSAFDTVLEATALSELSPVHREAVGLLAAERLALVTDGWVVALPPRIRRWPVPATGI